MRQQIIDPPGLIARAEEESLEHLAAAISADLEAERDAGMEQCRRRHSVGLRLIKAQGGVKHGAWVKWLWANFRLTKQRASEYVRYAKRPLSGRLEDDEARWNEVVRGPAGGEPAPAPTLNVEEWAGAGFVPEPGSPERQAELRQLAAGGSPGEAAAAREGGGMHEALTLDDWRGLAARQREDALTAGRELGTKTFNAQGDNEGIQWALWSWNPVTGCRHNCPYCYARDMANRFYETKFEPALWPARLSAPANTPFPRDRIVAEPNPARKMGLGNVFTCSMADLFGRWVPKEWIDAVLGVVREWPQWNFLFLTKFPQRMAEFRFPDNAWVGTTVDCQARVAVAEKAFRKIKAKVKWLSCEPLIEPLTFADLGVFDWLVLGGSSASTQTPEWRPPHEWILKLKGAAKTAGVITYDKPNLWGPEQGYPSLPYVAPTEAPEQLRYLPEAK